ncbi:hypothetical protein C8J57DRAFT_1573970 [Mycena rebaudengoi]|nr:hypothetical protein C8J57DRAFT_1573970 [Mycena rebaudengoi]
MAAMPMHFDVAPLTIPIFVGTILNWWLFGALYLYFIAFPADRIFMKILVVSILIAEILQTITDTRTSGDQFGAGWGNPSAIDEVGWAWFSVPVVGSIISGAGQNFFGYRIYVLSSKLWIPAIIAILTVVQTGAGIWSGVQISLAKKFSLLHMKNMKTTIVWLSASALCDLIIVAATVLYLAKQRGPEIRRQTNATLSRIIKLTVETGFLCTFFALLNLALFVKYENNYHLAVCIPLSKVYSNSIILILNSRAHIHSRRADDAMAESKWKASDSGLVFKNGRAVSGTQTHVGHSHTTVGGGSEANPEKNKDTSTTGVYSLGSYAV